MQVPYHWMGWEESSMVLSTAVRYMALGPGYRCLIFKYCGGFRVPFFFFLLCLVCNQTAVIAGSRSAGSP